MPIPTGERQFDQLAAELIATQCAANPLLGSALGLTEHDASLPDMSAEAVAAREREDDAWAARLRALDEGGLTAEERVDRALALMVLRGREIMRGWADWRRSPDHYAGTALSSVFLLLTYRLRPAGELAEVVAARLGATPALLEQGVANLDPSLAHPALLRRSISQIRAGAAYARSVAGEFADVDGGAATRVVSEAGEAAASAYERFAAHVESLIDRASGEWAIGEARYDALLREAEGLGYGTRELRERGQQAYDDLAADMATRAQELRGTDDFIAVVKSFNDEHPATPEDMLSLYRRATDAARAFCAERGLVTLPEGEHCEVVPSAPFSRAMLAVAHYLAPPPFAPPGGTSGVGHFFVPYPPDGATQEQVHARLATNNNHGAWSIAVHEAYPGHHWHLAWLSSRAATGQSRPLRFVLGSTYFTEGWGLYAEDLLREQGFFRTREQELCQRDYRLFRAARIVVDTSLHLGEMTVEEATDFMATRTSLSRDTAAAEVLRYCAWPTQASSYLTGALEIARMRDRWMAEERGPLQEFHDRAGGSGRLPIGLVERALFG